MQVVAVVVIIAPLPMRTVDLDPLAVPVCMELVVAAAMAAAVAALGVATPAVAGGVMEQAAEIIVGA
jgi:hypothetical protein